MYRLGLTFDWYSNLSISFSCPERKVVTPTRFVSPKLDASLGLRRSMPSTTTRFFIRAYVIARLAVINVLPSPDTAEVTIITRDSAPARVNDMLLRIRRNNSASGVVTFSPTTISPLDSFEREHISPSTGTLVRCSRSSCVEKLGNSERLRNMIPAGKPSPNINAAASMSILRGDTGASASGSSIRRAVLVASVF
ncbi:hypothetical protein IMSAGC008_02393 [Muribaculaceae bacterium]|nr:hypothetical protein IMSAGC008_02393 [Muribaculaceae bacterium]